MGANWVIRLGAARGAMWDITQAPPSLFAVRRIRGRRLGADLPHRRPGSFVSWRDAKSL